MSGGKASALFRLRKGMTIAELARAWAPEIGADVDAVARELGAAAANGELDHTGPQSGDDDTSLRSLGDDGRHGVVDSQYINAALAIIAAMSNDIDRGKARAALLLHRLVITREGLLAFADARRLPRPSWWRADAAKSAAPAKPPLTPTELAACMQQYVVQARAAGRPDPKQPELFEECGPALGATVREMRAAYKLLPLDMRRHQGDHDRKLRRR